MTMNELLINNGLIKADMVKKIHTDMILVDLQKAFNTLDHEIHPEKLK